MNKKTLKTNISNSIQNKSLFKFLIISNITLFAAYLFFVGATTIEVVNRKNIEESTRELQSNRASLEQVYNDESKMYTREYARTIGFIEAVPTFYATKTLTAVAYGTNQ